MEQIACPKCAEGNQPEAITCWACFTVLPGKDGEVAQSIREREARQDEELALENALSKSTQRRTLAVLGSWTIGGALAFSGLAALARRSPVAAAGVCGGLLTLGSMVLQHWREQKQPPDVEPVSERRLTVLSTSSAERLSKPPVVFVVDTILLHAAKDGASEVVIEPQLEELRVRYLVNGEWRMQMTLPRSQDACVEELKGRAGLDATHHQMQQGFLATRFDGQEQVWRVVTLPSVWSEAIVLRAEPMPFEGADITQHPLYASIGKAD